MLRFRERLFTELESGPATGTPRFLVSPGRINLLGEHTDYSGGYALPAAVDRGIGFAYRPGTNGRVRLRSLDEPGTVEFDGEGRAVGASTPPWGVYCGAVIQELAARGIRSTGLSGVLASDIPRGGGMSSSAALCVALSSALCDAAGLAMSPLDVCAVAQQAEHRVGVRCGIMDQYAIVHGEVGCALLLDCRGLTHRKVPFALSGYTLVVGDTAKGRGLVDSEYNTRRAQVEEAARLLDGGRGNIASLRDVTPALLAAKQGDLSPLLRRRARHVVLENARTLAAAEVLAQPPGDSGLDPRRRQLGELLNASHESLRDDFEVSCQELDLLVDVLRETGDELVPGARMMGGGFGGCVLALVATARLDEILDRATAAYQTRCGLTPAFFPVRPAPGVHFAPPDQR